MSRSKHTRPRRILAAARVRAPCESRSADDPSGRDRIGRRYKRMGVVLARHETPGQTAELPLPRVLAQKPRSGFLHPLSPPQVREALVTAGAEYIYGLRCVRLTRQPPLPNPAGLLLGRVIVPGNIDLYEQQAPPWTLEGRLSAADEARLVRSGAVVAVGTTNQTRVEWPGDTLRDFMLLEVLTHELAHHVLQQYGGKRTVRLARTKDHEAFAEQLAARLRTILRAPLA